MKFLITVLLTLVFLTGCASTGDTNTEGVTKEVNTQDVQRQKTLQVIATFLTCAKYYEINDMNFEKITILHILRDIMYSNSISKEDMRDIEVYYNNYLSLPYERISDVCEGIADELSTSA